MCLLTFLDIRNETTPFSLCYSDKEIVIPEIVENTYQNDFQI